MLYVSLKGQPTTEDSIFSYFNGVKDTTAATIILEPCLHIYED